MGRVAPHQNREVQLVLSGLKPLATIEKSKDCCGYSLAVSLITVGMLFGRVRPTKDDKKGEVAFTKPKNSYLIGEYNYLLNFGVQEYGIKEYHRKMGKLFGYAEEDIEEFINAEVKCDCSKCIGG